MALSVLPQVWVDSPGLWHNLAGMLVELMAMGILVFDHLLDICTPFFHQQQDGACRDFLMSIMHAQALRCGSGECRGTYMLGIQW